MSVGVRVSLAEAKAIADELVHALAPGCARIEVAGSIRRERPDIGDIELLAIPRVNRAREEDGLWGDREVEINLLAACVDALVQTGTLEEHSGGDRYTKLTHVPSGLQVDLFSVLPPATWGVLFLIRTGPATFSQWVVTEARRRFFHVVDGALHRGGLGCGGVACEVVDTPEEGDVLRALGISYRPPAFRDGVWR